MPRWIHTTVLLAVGAFGLASAGCAPPCDAYCSAAADHIEFCLENGSQGEWGAASWGTWNATSKNEYLSNCETDMVNQVADASNADVLNSTCNDQASVLSERTDFGLCAELP